MKRTALTEYRITVSLPPRELSPNWRGHWARKAKAVKKTRTEAWAAALEVTKGSKTRWTEATVAYTFHFRDCRRRDRDNLLASCKAVTDGLADAGLVDNDAAFTFLPVQCEVDRENPRLEILVKESAQ
jgi:crossover junction endodeoxyribonuclease RusA